MVADKNCDVWIRQNLLLQPNRGIFGLRRVVPIAVEEITGEHNVAPGPSPVNDGLGSLVVLMNVWNDKCAHCQTISKVVPSRQVKSSRG